MPLLAFVSLSLLPSRLVAQPPGESAGALQSGTWLIMFPGVSDTTVFRFELQFQGDSVIGQNSNGLPIKRHLAR